MITLIPSPILRPLIVTPTLRTLLFSRPRHRMLPRRMPTRNQFGTRGGHILRKGGHFMTDCCCDTAVCPDCAHCLVPGTTPCVIRIKANGITLCGPCAYNGVNWTTITGGSKVSGFTLTGQWDCLQTTAHSNCVWNYFESPSTSVTSDTFGFSDCSGGALTKVDPQEFQVIVERVSDPDYQAVITYKHSPASGGLAPLILGYAVFTTACNSSKTGVANATAGACGDMISTGSVLTGTHPLFGSGGTMDLIPNP